MTCESVVRRNLLLAVVLAAGVGACVGDSSVVGPDPLDAIATVRISPRTANVKVGDTSQLSGLVLNGHGSVVDIPPTWSSSAPTVATVAQSGIVTGVEPGFATITASAGGTSGSALIIVELAPVASVVISPASVTLSVGEEATLTATLRDASLRVLGDRVVRWSTSDSEIVSRIVSAGRQQVTITGRGPGTAVITATSEGVSRTATVTVLDPVLEFYEFVRRDIEAFWASTLGSFYRPITTFTPYTVPIEFPCGTTKLNNASYCTANEGVYYDYGFMLEFWVNIGDMAPAFIIAHEIGHHVSSILGWRAVNTLKTNEAQADCLGGAWTRDADNRELLEQGDLEEAVSTLFEIGSPDNTWFDPTLHGTGDQRVFAFAAGYDQGFTICINQSFLDLFPVQDLP